MKALVASRATMQGKSSVSVHRQWQSARVEREVGSRYEQADIVATRYGPKPFELPTISKRLAKQQLIHETTGQPGIPVVIGGGGDRGHVDAAVIDRLRVPRTPIFAISAPGQCATIALANAVDYMFGRVFAIKALKHMAANQRRVITLSDLSRYTQECGLGVRLSKLRAVENMDMARDPWNFITNVTTGWPLIVRISQPTIFDHVVTIITSQRLLYDGIESTGLKVTEESLTLGRDDDSRYTPRIVEVRRLWPENTESPAKAKRKEEMLMKRLHRNSRDQNEEKNNNKNKMKNKKKMKKKP